MENEKIAAVSRAELEAIRDQLVEIAADVADFSKSRPRIQRPELQVVERGDGTRTVYV